MIHDDQFAQASRPPIVLTSEDRERLLSLKDAAMDAGGCAVSVGGARAS